MSDSWPRRRLLAILRGASEPLDARELARITGQHVTTVRFHLDVLTRDSLVRQFQQPPRGRGRPRIGYRAVQRSVGYQQLAEVLADQLGADRKQRTAAAVAAGRAMATGFEVIEHPMHSLAEVRELAVSMMSELGFAPERDESRDTDTHSVVRMSGCPLRELARTHPDVVCNVHLGLVEQLLDRNGSAEWVDVDLDPFIEPEMCELRLMRRARTGSSPLRSVGSANDASTLEVGEACAAEVNGVSVSESDPDAPQLRDADADVSEQPAQQW